jgi:hypothetical protein
MDAWDVVTGRALRDFVRQCDEQMEAGLRAEVARQRDGYARAVDEANRRGALGAMVSEEGQLAYMAWVRAERELAAYLATK